MINQKSALLIPLRWREKFVLKRIDEKDIVISLEERNEILRALSDGKRFIQIRKYTLMLNAIKSIDPYWDGDNIPPRPEIREVLDEVKGGKAVLKRVGEKEQEEWDRIFGKNKLKEGGVQNVR